MNGRERRLRAKEEAEAEGDDCSSDGAGCLLMIFVGLFALVILSDCARSGHRTLMRA